MSHVCVTQVSRIDRVVIMESESGLLKSVSDKQVSHLDRCIRGQVLLYCKTGIFRGWFISAIMLDRGNIPPRKYSFSYALLLIPTKIAEI